MNNSIKIHLFCIFTALHLKTRLVKHNIFCSKVTCILSLWSNIKSDTALVSGSEKACDPAKVSEHGS